MKLGPAEPYARIHELEADNKLLREALRPFAEETEDDPRELHGEDNELWLPRYSDLTWGDFRRARAALSEGERDGS